LYVNSFSTKDVVVARSDTVHPLFAIIDRVGFGALDQGRFHGIRIEQQSTACPE